MPISLKKFEQKAPELLSLAKKAKFSLSKYNLEHIISEVAFVLDASCSMTPQYQQNHVQYTLERVFPIAIQFNANNSIKTWAFAYKQKQLNSISFENYKNFVNVDNGGWQQWMNILNSSYNNEPIVMKAIIKHFFNLEAPVLETPSSGLSRFVKKIENEKSFALKQSPQKPVWVLFISDSGVGHNEDIEFLIRWSSTLPIFWQFIGIGGFNYGILERIHELNNLFINNANFFAIDNLFSITEQELYDKMIQKFSEWIELAKKHNMINVSIQFSKNRYIKELL